jgi:hypothetical protein
VILLDVGVFGVEGIDLSLVKCDFVLEVGDPLLGLQVKWPLDTESLDCEASFRGLALFFHDVIYNEITFAIGCSPQVDKEHTILIAHMSNLLPIFG